MKKKKLIMVSILISLASVALSVVRLYMKKDDDSIDINSDSEIHSI